MNDSVIAIRTADGALVPVLEKGARNRKQLVVTTARNNQKRVHLDMYEGPADDLASSEYIGSLVVDQIDPAAAGETEIRFVAGLDDRGQLKATATNLANGDSQSLSISLNEGDRETGEESATEDLGDLPDFSMDDEVADDLDSLESEDAAGESFEIPDKDQESLESEDAAGESFEMPDNDLESLEESSYSFDSGEDSDTSEGTELSEQFDEPPLFDDDFDIEERSEDSQSQETSSDDDLEEVALEDIPIDGAEDSDQPGEETPEGFEIETQDEPEIEQGFDSEPEIEQGFDSEPETEPATDIEPDFEDEDFDLPEPETTGESASEESAFAEDDFALPEPDTSEDDGVFPTPSTADSTRGVSEDEEEQAASRPSMAFYMAYMLLALGILAGLIYLIYGALQGEPIPPLESGRPLLASFFPLLFANRRITRRSSIRRRSPSTVVRNAGGDT